RQRPTLPHSFPCSTIGGSRLNFRVRNGNGCDPAPMTTGILVCLGFPPSRLTALRRGKPRPATTKLALASEVGIVPDNLVKEHSPSGSYPPSRCALRRDTLNILQTVVSRDPRHAVRSACIRNYGQASRRISIGQLNVSPRLHLRPINLVIFQEPSGILRSREISSCGGFHA